MGMVSDFLFGNAAANAQKSAANSAAKASQYATDKSLAFQQKVYDQTRSDFAPWLQAGSNALAQISDPSKVNANFMASPDYQYRMQQGTQAVAQSRAVNGLLHSGSALKALTDYGQQTGAAEFGNWWNRQAGVAGVGQGAAGSDAAAGGNYANSSQNALLTNAQNLAQSSYAKGNATAGFYGFLNGRLNAYADQAGGSFGG